MLYFISVLFMPTVDHELSFQDKYLFYRFLDDEEEDAVLPSDDEKREAEEELQETLLFLSQIGPDAHMRMILRKPWVTNSAPAVFIHLKYACWSHPISICSHILILSIFTLPELLPSYFVPCSLYRPGQRTAEDLEIIYDELLHIKALSHLSNTVRPPYNFWASFTHNAWCEHTNMSCDRAAPCRWRESSLGSSSLSRTPKQALSVSFSASLLLN